MNPSASTRTRRRDLVQDMAFAITFLSQHRDHLDDCSCQAVYKDLLKDLRKLEKLAVAARDMLDDPRTIRDSFAWTIDRKRYDDLKAALDGVR